MLILIILAVSYSTTPLAAETNFVPQTASTLNLSGEFGVSWAGDDVVYAMTTRNSENSTILAGYTTSSGAGGSDVWLLNVTSRLNYLNDEPWYYRDMVEWRRTYGGKQDDGAKSVIQSSDGAYVVAGYTASYGAGGSDDRP